MTKERFVGRTIPVIVAALAFTLAGVLAVDVYIEHRQQELSTHVAASTISTLRTVADFGRALDRFHDAAEGRDESQPRAASALIAQSARLTSSMEDFEEHVRPDELESWRGLRDRAVGFALNVPVEPNLTPAALRERVERLNDDLDAIVEMVNRRGIEMLRTAQRQHMFEGALEGCVVLLLGLGAVSLLLGWRRQEALARTRDAEVEDQLRRAVADLDGFAGRLAHDLRSPLMPILLGSRWIERAGVPDAVREHAERIERSARRLGRMIDALLQYARAQAGDAGEVAITRGKAAIEETVADFAEQATAHGGRVDTALDDDAEIACSAEMLQSIVANLLDNALKYGAKDGASPHITVRSRREGSSFVVEVEDRGPGIPSDLRERVFEPMFRAHRGGAGVGLGLSIVKRVVEAQHGRIEVREGADGGACFRVLLPICERAPREEAPAVH